MEHLAGQTDAQWHKLERQREEIDILKIRLDGVNHANVLLHERVQSLKAELAAVREAIMSTVNAQADDEGLWFKAKTAPEGYLQQELRILHDVIEKALGDK